MLDEKGEPDLTYLTSGSGANEESCETVIEEANR